MSGKMHGIFGLPSKPYRGPGSQGHEDLGQRAWARGPGPGGLGQRAWARGPGLEGLGQRTWARGPGPEGLGQRAWARGPGPEGLGQKAWARWTFYRTSPFWGCYPKSVLQMRNLRERELQRQDGSEEIFTRKFYNFPRISNFLLMRRGCNLLSAGEIEIKRLTGKQTAAKTDRGLFIRKGSG